MRKNQKETQASSREKRREGRVDEEDRISVEILPGEGASDQVPPIKALTKDISAGGVRIISGVTLEPGTKVLLEIFLAGRRQLIKVDGVVRWSRSAYGEDLFELGVEFVGLKPDVRMTLLEHIYTRRR